MRNPTRNMASKKSITRKKQTICFVAGRSGGHITPCLTLAKRWKQEHTDGKVLFFSTHTTLDQQLLKNNAVIDRHTPLTLGNIPKKKYKLPFFVWRLGIAFLRSIYQLIKHRPTKVISTGGYIAIPVCLSGKVLRIPIELYELNVVPGKATQFLAPWADVFHTCFKQTQDYLPKIQCTYTPYPVKYTDKDKKISREAAHEFLKLDNTKKTILILGGSQGSALINNAVQEQLNAQPELHKSINIIHQTGPAMEKKMHNFYAKLNIPAIVFSYKDDLKNFYAAANLVICRSGAGSLAEVIFWEKQCITIPLETKANTHQLKNAYAAAQEHPELIKVVRQKKRQNKLF